MVAGSDSYDTFLEEYADLIEKLAHSGWTSSEAYHRLIMLYTDVPTEYIHRAINSGHWTFVGRQKHVLNHVMMACALWYAVSVTHDFEPDPAYTAVALDPVVIRDVPHMLEAAGVSAQNIAIIMGRAGAALKYLAENPYLRLDEASYDEFIDDLPAEARQISDEIINWPPERSIIEDRLGDGSWSTALLRVGVCPPDLENLGLSVAASSVTDLSCSKRLLQMHA